MKTNDILAFFNIADLRDLPDAVASLLDGDRDTRDSAYRELVRLNGYDFSYDWFQEAYEEELAQRKQKKQDFTPNELGRLCSILTGSGAGTLHEPTAGNGSMVIAWWHMMQRQVLPWEFFPSEHMVYCWELSDRSIPILLLNLSIRGIMGYVYHGDVLEKQVKNRYILLNRTDDCLGFSDVVRANENLIIKPTIYDF